MKTIVQIELLDHISAGQLREMGCDLPDDIPDDWITPRAGLVWSNPEVAMEGDVMHISIPVRCTGGFRAALVYELEDGVNK